MALEKAVKAGKGTSDQEKGLKRAISACVAVGGLDAEVEMANAALEEAVEQAAMSGAGGDEDLDDPTQGIIDGLKAKGETVFVDPGFPHTEASISPDPSHKTIASYRSNGAEFLRPKGTMPFLLLLLLLRRRLASSFI